MEYNCANPQGDACDGKSWTEYGNVDYKNYMGAHFVTFLCLSQLMMLITGYAMLDPVTGKYQHCQDTFSPQQIRRIHCYLRNELAGWVV